MQGLIITGITFLLVAARIALRVIQVLKKNNKARLLAEKLERESRTFENLDKITVKDFIKVVQGRPYFIVDENKRKVITKTVTSITQANGKDYVYFLLDTTPDMIEADIKLVRMLEEGALFIVASRKVDLLPTYVVPNVKIAYKEFVHAYELTRQYFEVNGIERVGRYLKSLIKKYYIDENYNCAESLIRAGNEYYNLEISDNDMKLVGGFGGGLQCGNTCGALLSATSILSMKFIEDKAHESEDLQEVVSEYVDRFKEAYGSTLCSEIKPFFFCSECRCQETVETACDLLEAVVDEYEVEKSE